MIIAFVVTHFYIAFLLSFLINFLIHKNSLHSKFSVFLLLI